jgi:hypothetical protein
MGAVAKLRVFISWAGDQAETLGKGFRDFLPDVVNGIEPFISASDIDKGTRWSDALKQNLQESPCAIVCVTPESLKHVWVAFQTGAISRAAGGPDDAKARIWTYLLGLGSQDLQLTPFAAYQATRATKEDTFRLVESINNLSPDPAKPDSLERKFERLFWPSFEAVISKAATASSAHVVASKPNDLLSEILLTVRTIQDDLKRQSAKIDWIQATQALPNLGSAALLPYAYNLGSSQAANTLGGATPAGTDLGPDVRERLAPLSRRRYSSRTIRPKESAEPLPRPPEEPSKA